MGDCIRFIFFGIAVFGLAVNFLATLGIEPIAGNCDEIPFCFAVEKTDG